MLLVITEELILRAEFFRPPFRPTVILQTRTFHRKSGQHLFLRFLATVGLIVEFHIHTFIGLGHLYNLGNSALVYRA